jgi:hypothetical protein
MKLSPSGKFKYAPSWVVDRWRNDRIRMAIIRTVVLPISLKNSSGYSQGHTFQEKPSMMQYVNRKFLTAKI